MITSESFEEVLKKFKYKMIDGEIHPVLMDGDISDLTIFILDEADKLIEKIDPNEGDPGSYADQEADYS